MGEIRRRVLVVGGSRRQIIHETGMHWETLQKLLQHSEPPGHRQTRKRPCKKLGPYLPKIELILREDKLCPASNGIFQASVPLGNMGGWKLRGAGDLDGDHKAELFWQNAAGVVDIDGDGVSDLFWQTRASIRNVSKGWKGRPRFFQAWDNYACVLCGGVF